MKSLCRKLNLRLFFVTSQRFVVNNSKRFVLGIETSCDDTCAAVVSFDGEVKANVVSSQLAMHSTYNGIVPNLAARAHEQNIDIVVEEAQRLAGFPFTHETLEAVCVTQGPGLQPCLDIGIKKGREIAKSICRPLVPIHHLEGHALVSRLPSLNMNLEFPFLLLLISGGHTQLLNCLNVSSYDLIGSTLDDAVGEAFDKTARLLDLRVDPENPVHPGELLERLAKLGDPNSFPFTVPLIRTANKLDFSYSGLKTQVKYEVNRGKATNDDTYKANIAACFQRTAIDHLINRVSNSLKKTKSSTLVVAGGVARNMYMRDQLSVITKKFGTRIAFPPLNLCTDNGVMIAWAGIEKLKQGTFNFEREEELKPLARWPLAELNL